MNNTYTRYLFASILLWMWAGVCMADVKQAELKTGMVAPDWMMQDINGNSYSLYAELEKGNRVVMVFWASWCKFCRELMPDIGLFKKSLADDTVKFFAMNIWEDGDPVAYFDSKNIQVPLILKADALAKRYAIDGTPGVVFVGLDKKIKYVRHNDEDTTAVMRRLQTLVLQQ
ncbi:Thiol-disulfide isomerase or thioredoxin [Alteromonadaceae bacterium Bs31]|nr:Thiol-disulfide isomerase or thioredoxin [Alteromonadaceae bacterium Bs31]